MIESHNVKPPTPQQVEKIRLLLSTYQDGTGQLKLKKHTNTLPDWRQYERAVAVAMGGFNTENKGLFDVLIPASTSAPFGISCKMRSELRTAQNKGVVTLEVSNAAGEFWDELRSIGIATTTQMAERPDEAGVAICNVVSRWAEYAEQFHALSLAMSYYLVLLWDSKTLEFQLYQLPLPLPEPSKLEWSVRFSKNAKKEGSGSLIGTYGGRVLVEWYGNSGGQLKCYPDVSEAIWYSDIFRLEPLPFSENGYGIEQKAATFFKELWATTNSS